MFKIAAINQNLSTLPSLVIFLFFKQKGSVLNREKKYKLRILPRASTLIYLVRALSHPGDEPLVPLNLSKLSLFIAAYCRRILQLIFDLPRRLLELPEVMLFVSFFKSASLFSLAALCQISLSKVIRSPVECWSTNEPQRVRRYCST